MFSITIYEKQQKGGVSMPIYTYKCEQCGHTEQYIHSISQNPEFKCEKCGGNMKKEIPTKVGVVYKQNGFYSKDNQKR